MADIEQAFLNIELTTEDSEAVRFLWFANKEDDTLVHYRWKRLPFGLTSSPFVLKAVLKKHLESMEPEYQLTAGQISEQTYVDDVMGGAETVSAALKQAEDSAAICVAAGMRLRKWKTNSAELRIALDPEGNESTANGVLSQVIAGDVTTKALGLQWETYDDLTNVHLQPKRYHQAGERTEEGTNQARYFEDFRKDLRPTWPDFSSSSTAKMALVCFGSSTLHQAI